MIYIKAIIFSQQVAKIKYIKFKVFFVVTCSNNLKANEKKLLNLEALNVFEKSIKEILQHNKDQIFLKALAIYGNKS